MAWLPFGLQAKPGKSKERGILYYVCFCLMWYLGKGIVFSQQSTKYHQTCLCTIFSQGHFSKKNLISTRHKSRIPSILHPYAPAHPQEGLLIQFGNLIFLLIKFCHGDTQSSFHFYIFYSLTAFFPSPFILKEELFVFITAKNTICGNVMLPVTIRTLQILNYVTHLNSTQRTHDNYHNSPDFYYKYLLRRDNLCVYILEFVLHVATKISICCCQLFSSSAFEKPHAWCCQLSWFK